MSVTTELGIVHGMPDRTYHARPELSSTQARQILDSPARYKWRQSHPVSSPAFDLGTAVHTKILGTGAQVVTYPDEHLTPAGKPSTKAATVAWENEQRTAGYVILTAADLARVDAMAESVLAHREARRILETPGDSEVSAFATDPETGVPCRARFDRLTDRLAVDLKTTAGSASPTGFGASAAKFDYPVQEAWYADTLSWITGERIPMVFVVVEKAAPYLVAVHQFDEVTRMVATELAQKARRIYAACLSTNTWPGYGDDTITTQIPNWWFNAAEDDADEMSI